ncbi:protein-disulfide isomerase [Hahella sp. CCB-MM4]|uniref:DsbC family protein n=1 Tax=Hahella sp. (strain CCB-MM4) TaxID=1926491 RepID=UPI000BD675DA|nr:DsbC family protein [Hahella sp. CCB-MM4]OZG70641.1 protein-disulfide isomerase [Hahella sp. CCB-MM4]
MRLFQYVLILGMVFSAGMNAHADDDPVTVIKQRLAEAVPGLRVVKVSPSPLDGLYEVESNNPNMIYISSDGRYFVAGDIYKVEDGRITNLAEQRRESTRAELVNAVPESQMVVFKPEGEPKAKVTVFTDVDCGYCRKLHREIAKINELGIQVNYMAYPRAGVGSSSYTKMVSVWCANDRQAAITEAKAGKVPEAKDCPNPVADQYELGNKIGITGTPAIVLDDGRLIPGYVPAESLAKGLGLAAN